MQGCTAVIWCARHVGEVGSQVGSAETGEVRRRWQVAGSEGQRLFAGDGDHPLNCECDGQPGGTRCVAADALRGWEVSREVGKEAVDPLLLAGEPEAAGNAKRIGRMRAFETGGGGQVPIGEMDDVNLQGPAVGGRAFEGRLRKPAEGCNGEPGDAGKARCIGLDQCGYHGPS